MPTRVGFLGVGIIARAHAEAVRELGHTTVAGSATSAGSPRWLEFKSIAPQARFRLDGHALIGDKDVDAVVACLPWNVTESWLPRLLATPKPVMIEKPVALTAAALSAAMAGQPAWLENKIIGFNRRFYRTVQTLKKRIDQGGMKSVEITISETISGLAATYGPQIIEHILVYSSSHPLDTAVYLLGPLQPVKIYGHQERAYAKPFRSVTGLLETEQNTPVFLSIMADNPAPMGIRAYFDDQTTWHLSPLERLIAYKGYERVEPSPESQIRRYFPKPFLEINEDADFKPGFLDQMKAFLNGEGKQIAATLPDGLELLRFTENILKVSGGLDQ